MAWATTVQEGQVFDVPSSKLFLAMREGFPESEEDPALTRAKESLRRKQHRKRTPGTQRCRIKSRRRVVQHKGHHISLAPLFSWFKAILGPARAGSEFL